MADLSSRGAAEPSARGLLGLVGCVPSIRNESHFSSLNACLCFSSAPFLFLRPGSDDTIYFNLCYRMIILKNTNKCVCINTLMNLVNDINNVVDDNKILCLG